VSVDREPGDFRPTAGWPNLLLRGELLARTRAFFAERGFLEVETPLLSADVVVDRYLDPLSVILPDDPRQPDRGRKLWLQTSPEFGMKRLLAAGGEAIYQITRSFRAGERGPLHNLEFTIVEWYRRDDDMWRGMQMLSDLAEALLHLGPTELISYADAFERHVGVDPHAATVEQLRAAASRQGVSVSQEFAAADRDNWLNLLLAELVEPHLGNDRPAILYDYPASQAALARTYGDPPVAARFELYVRGIELANGYHELLDADTLRRRDAEANQKRAAEGKPQLPGDSRLLSAMVHGLPECTGVALGFDRLLMLAAGAKTIDEVLAFPIERA
jgi:lysyl-tRNA synthetase class 2